MARRARAVPARRRDDPPADVAVQAATPHPRGHRAARSLGRRLRGERVGGAVALQPDARTARRRPRHGVAVCRRTIGAFPSQPPAGAPARLDDERRDLPLSHPGAAVARAEPLRRQHRRLRDVAGGRDQHRFDRGLDRGGTDARAAGRARDGNLGIADRMIKFKVTHVSRPDMDIEARRDLKLLEAVEQDSRVTQRNLAGRLGIALGLTNIYLKRLVRKGYIKCVNVQSNRITYLITPRGIAEKARLTYEFMDYSLHLYGEVRQHLREALQECAAADRRIAIYGRGEAAEIAYLSLKEYGMDPVAVFDVEGGQEFLGMPVRPLREHTDIAYDLMIVATLERSSDRQLAGLEAAGVPKDKLFPLRQEPVAVRRKVAL